ncbi:NAD(P) transhydrogenase subunit alpha [Actinobacteria bacterium YIM 96077]|uniref:proton-translocating NAD(P)(+) transhydrogenase n=1 Tax=Phytoactinopolyspora halophila TaxID=1981511 RepID=A0A329QBZ4_9ACTN|nr:NAD(P) transhydrogenase subunit alpha [Phytoactinopolyspora halophila]AYY11833.1 NAD(P) transhydrogenase subunit alpha [Actinobacteria bacterium YIM 96077]RAW09854.1 NAD(P) transhydrogenase subunit alpha [Phytoactinopolyspora halophila]
MDPQIALLTIFILAIFTGYEVVSKVSSTLHTPLMSGANAIHGIILVGAVLVTGNADGAAELTVGVIATVLATLNLVGGFVVTDRMLEMFKVKKAPAANSTAGSDDAKRSGGGA